MGAGRVGTTLARSLETHGHSVAIIDQNPDSFRRLPDEFEGQRVVGLGFDRDALARAGIEDAHAFAAVSSGDNSNILAARVVREVFGVEHVVARIYDPKRAEIYERLGITTVATVRWTADQVLRRLIPAGAHSLFRDASGAVSLVQADSHPGWIGWSITHIEAAIGARVAYLARLGVGYVPAAHDLLQEGDLVHLLVGTDGIDEVQRRLAVAPAEEED
ncbi:MULTISPECIES: TrkA family potassium uptake protein [unclassified Pseudactinotalea]|uniref:potassium channel family protein n=1 Tax=unclassified Pseudactinotalea TaxID=2649176 RepID=UPI00128B1627|nr:MULTISPECIES: TrkA family potassium uptake protein [unclassified Pseudactinotalea]MPV49411.1 TrkA family potassium uptake protein [Pseudactinotalea sp. HY160]QGH70973.1 TrkA family potassium uptake protein [Pseudactinotalea sp. HY158]